MTGQSHPGREGNALGWALGKVLTHRYLVAILNLAAAYVVFLLFLHIRSLFELSPEHLHELTESLTGVGVLMIGWGVALEERGVIRHIFRMPNMEDPVEVYVDEVCHAYGVGLLVVGLFSETLVEFVKLPNTVVNTEGVDEYVLIVSAALLAICLLFLVISAVRLIFPRPLAAAH